MGDLIEKLLIQAFVLESIPFDVMMLLSAALRFLTMFHREPTDYVEISRRFYEGQTIDEIFERARVNWKE